MNAVLISANVLVLFTFILHTFGGDKEYRSLEPESVDLSKQEKWTMGRGAFHIVSADFLLASVGLTLINFTNYFSDKKLLLNILSIYFLAYGVAFLLTVIISRKFPKNYLKLGQWMLLFVISGLIYYGAN